MRVVVSQRTTIVFEDWSSVRACESTDLLPWPALPVEATVTASPTRFSADMASRLAPYLVSDGDTGA